MKQFRSVEFSRRLAGTAQGPREGGRLQDRSTDRGRRWTPRPGRFAPTSDVDCDGRPAAICLFPDTRRSGILPNFHQWDGLEQFAGGV